MIRVVATAIMLLLALIAFRDDALGSGYIICAAFVLIAAVTWFKWAPIREAFRSAKDESDVPIIRLSSRIIGGMRRGEPARRASNA